MIARAAQRIVALSGWRRLGAAFIAGAITLFAFPPFSIVPVLWLAFPPLMLMLDGCKTRAGAAATGWAFGFGFFSTGIYWIANAFYVDSETFGAIAIPAVAALAAGLGLFMAIVTAVTHLLPAPRDADMPDDQAMTMALRVVLFAAMWTAMEWLRSWIFTGFPWNPMGLVWSEEKTPLGLPILQVTPLIGTYGLSLLTVFAAAAPAILLRPPRFWRAWALASAPLALLAVIGIGGVVRLSVATSDVVPGVKFRLVQANIPQTERAFPSRWDAQLQDYIDLSTKGRPADITHVVWGEAAMPPTFFLNLDAQRRQLAATAAPPGGALITGGDRGIRGDGYWAAIYNSLYVLSPSAEIVGVYDKTHLVPFGEYMPFRWLIPFEKITGGIGDFAVGTGLKTLSIPGLPPFTPLICYEAIFSGNVTARDGFRPRWLLNLTNDSWFGMSAGPRQHLAAARLRAVEEGIPMVRTANSGISAVMDGYGRTVAQLDLGQRGVVDAPLPAPAARFTPFGILGNFIALALATLAGAGALLFDRRRKPSVTWDFRG